MCYRWEGGEKAWKKKKKKERHAALEEATKTPKPRAGLTSWTWRKKVQKEMVQCWKALWYSLCFDRFLRWRERWWVVVRNRREVRAHFGKVEGKKNVRTTSTLLHRYNSWGNLQFLGKKLLESIRKEGKGGEEEGVWRKLGLFCLWEDGRRGGGSEKFLWSGWRKPANPKALRFSGQKRRKVELRKWCTRGQLDFSGISF